MTAPFTVELLELVQKVTRNFMNPSYYDDDEDNPTIEPHLHVFLSYLTFEKRPRDDPIFNQWIEDHYSAKDVLDLYDDGAGGIQPDFTRVADNLPGVMQYLDLVRDSGAVFGLPDLPDNVVDTHNEVTRDRYAEDDYRMYLYDRAAYVTSKEYDAALQQRRRSQAAKKRKGKKMNPVVAEVENGGDAADGGDEPNIVVAEEYSGLRKGHGKDCAADLEPASDSEGPADVEGPVHEDVAAMRARIGASIEPDDEDEDADDEDDEEGGMVEYPAALRERLRATLESLDEENEQDEQDDTDAALRAALRASAEPEEIGARWVGGFDSGEQGARFGQQRLFTGVRNREDICAVFSRCSGWWGQSRRGWLGECSCRGCPC